MGDGTNRLVPQDGQAVPATTPCPGTFHHHLPRQPPPPPPNPRHATSYAGLSFLTPRGVAGTSVGSSWEWRRHFSSWWCWRRAQLVHLLSVAPSTASCTQRCYSCKLPGKETRPCNSHLAAFKSTAKGPESGDRPQTGTSVHTAAGRGRPPRWPVHTVECQSEERRAPGTCSSMDGP